MKLGNFLRILIRSFSGPVGHFSLVSVTYQLVWRRLCNSSEILLPAKLLLWSSSGHPVVKWRLHDNGQSSLPFDRLL